MIFTANVAQDKAVHLIILQRLLKGSARGQLRTVVFTQRPVNVFLSNLRRINLNDPLVKMLQIHGI